jgi:hypothetical protein
MECWGIKVDSFLFTDIVIHHQKIVASPYMALGCIKVEHS